MKDLIKEGYKIPREWREEYETCEISDEVRAEIMRDKWRTQNFAFNHNRCNFPGELWRHCKGDCGCCAYQVPGDRVFLDAPANYEDEDDTPMSSYVPDDGLSISEIVEGYELRMALYAAIKKLPQKERVIVELFLKDTNKSKIAKALHIPGTTCADRYARAIRRLREMLTDYM